MGKYRVWDPMNEDERSAREFEADSAEEAAEAYAQRDYEHGGLVDGDTWELEVRGAESGRVQVTTDWDPTFTGELMKPPVPLVHVLIKGRPICGQPKGFPGSWPEGQTWRDLRDFQAGVDVTAGGGWCPTCARAASRPGPV